MRVRARARDEGEGEGEGEGESEGKCKASRLRLEDVCHHRAVQHRDKTLRLRRGRLVVADDAPEGEADQQDGGHEPAP